MNLDGRRVTPVSAGSEMLQRITQTHSSVPENDEKAQYWALSAQFFRPVRWRPILRRKTFVLISY